jgi:hypothetical protein
LNHRLGLCLGFFNGAVYFYLLLIPLYVAGYLTLQISSGDSDPASIQWINKIRNSVHDNKIDRVIAAYDPMPKNYYMAADIVGLMKNNPLLESRLARYPVFLALAERQEFQDVARDVQLQQMFQSQAGITEILKHPKVQAIVTNAAITSEIVQLIGSDLADLNGYLETGKSEKYGDEKILGIWTVDPAATVMEMKKKNPALSGPALNQFRNRVYAMVSGLSLTATIDKRAILKKEKENSDGLPEIVAQGSWNRDGGSYEITLPDGKPETVQATMKGEETMLLPRNGVTIVLTRDL